MRGGRGKGSFKKERMQKSQCLRGEDEEEAVSMRGGRGKGSFKKGRIRKRQCENLSVPHCHCSLPVCIHAGFIFRFMGTVKKEGKKGIKKRNQNTVQNRCGWELGNLLLSSFLFFPVSYSSFSFLSIFLHLFLVLFSSFRSFARSESDCAQKDGRFKRPTFEICLDRKKTWWMENWRKIQNILNTKTEGTHNSVNLFESRNV